MSDLKLLKEKIESLRSDLDQAITDNLPPETIYQKSQILDKAIEEYLYLVEDIK